MRSAIPAVILVHGEPRDIDPWVGAAALAAMELKWRAAQLDFSRQFARSSVTVADKSGHVISRERPDLVVSAVVEVERLGQTAKSN